mgnify:CR=1 FL=1
MFRPFVLAITLLTIGHAKAFNEPSEITNEFVLSECFVENVRSKARCGKLNVPENRDLPLSQSNQISLNIVVLPKFKEESKALPLLFLAGGPGQAATELAGMLNGPLHDLRQEHDIVLIDQRGTGQSSPLKCDAEEIDSLTYDDKNLDLKQETLDCLSTFSDKHLPSYNTYNSIEDFEDVRKALGFEQVHIFGGSYGTRAGFAYLKLHPESIKTAILDSNAPMELVIGFFGKTSERAFELLVEDCKAHKKCNEAFPNLKQDFMSLMGRLQKSPVTQTAFHPATGEKVTMVLTQKKVAEALRSTLYDLSSRQMLPFIVNRAANEDYRALAAWIGRSVDSERAPGALYTGLTMNIICNEDIPRALPTDFKNDADNYFNGELGYSMFTEVCQYWPAWEAPNDFTTPVTADVPVLLFSGKYDPVTPPAYGEMAIEHLPKAKHIVIEHGSHVASLRHCVEPIKDFVKTASFENIDFSCATDSVPNMFFTDLNQLH